MLISFWLDLSAAVDVYSDWVDACDAVAKEDVGDRGGEYATSRPTASRPGGGRAGDDDEDLEDLIDDDEDGGGGYGGEGIVGDDDDI
jgi:transcription elongation factor 1